MKKKIAFVIACLFAFCSVGCAKDDKANIKRGLNDYGFSSASLAATDSLGREVTPMYTPKTDKQRYVGMFYWLWMGNHDHQFGVYDNTKLMSTPDGQNALFSVDNPPGDGMPNASPLDYMHWTNEPLFGYYNSSDPFIISRHIEMLTMADIDFVFFDTTNHAHYAYNYSQHTIEASKIKGAGTAFLDTLLEYYDKGWDVPQVIFYTNTKSGTRVDEIFKSYYKDGKYDKLWFAPNDKPMIIGTTQLNDGASDMNPSDSSQYVNISDSMQQYFDVFESQWPTMQSKDNGFPWMSWENPQHYHSDTKTVSVSVSQHSRDHIIFNMRDKWSSKGYDYVTDTVEKNWQAGKNFENGWESVFNYEQAGKDIEFVSVTGWNEWVVQKWKSEDAAYKDPIKNPNGMMMVDNFDAEYSRDIEPDKNHYKDNVYMQLVRNVRKLKYKDLPSSKMTWPKKTIKSVADFSGTQAVYKDFEGEARERDFVGFDIRSKSIENKLLGSYYTDKTNRNDIAETKIIHDNKNLYMLVTTVNPITQYQSGENWMNILIQAGETSESNSFSGYNYIINRKPTPGKASIEKSSGGWNWQNLGSGDMLIEGNKMLLTIPLSALGLDSSNIKFNFKVSDNVSKPSHFNLSDPDNDIMHYYVTGDSAPIGRLNYSYGY